MHTGVCTCKTRGVATQDINIDIEVIGLTFPESQGTLMEGIGRKLRDILVERFANDHEIPYQVLLIQSTGGRDVNVLKLPRIFELRDERYPLWLKHCIKSFSPFMVVQMSEVWMLRCNTPEEREEFERWRGGVRRPFSEHPDRMESVWLGMEYRAGVECWTAEIERPEGNPATLGAWGQVPAEATCSGDFVGLMDLPH